MGFTGTVVSDYNGIGWAQTRQLMAAAPDEVGALGVSAGMDVELPGALADALFGVTNPAGKLPVTLPRHVGQVPVHHGQRTGSGYRRTKADIHHGYLDMPATPLFPFGHGLSYTTAGGRLLTSAEAARGLRAVGHGLMVSL